MTSDTGPFLVNLQETQWARKRIVSILLNSVVLIILSHRYHSNDFK